MLKFWHVFKFPKENVPGGTFWELLCVPPGLCTQISSGNKRARKDGGEEDGVAHADFWAIQGRVNGGLSRVLHLG